MTVGVIDRDPRPPVIRPARLDLLADLDAVQSVPLTSTTGTPADQRPTDRHPTADVGPSGSIAAGRGLLIVDQLGDEWGVAERTDGKEVWLTVPVRWAHVHECGCDQPAIRNAGSRMHPYRGVVGQPGGRSRSVAARWGADPGVGDTPIKPQNTFGLGR